jgi:hypothetical protein
MQETRDRARANLPTVMLTLLSIVQALALEFLWTYIRENPQLFALNWLNTLTWIQIVTSLLGLILIWIVYASHVMRFRWVPTTTDSIYPFVIGLLEFSMIEFLGHDRIGPWMICYSALFALMVWISHRTMRRARLDGENTKFFEHLAPASLKDFYFSIGVISLLAITGVYISATINTGVLAMIGILMTAALVSYQFYDTASYWEKSLSDDWSRR